MIVFSLALVILQHTNYASASADSVRSTCAGVPQWSFLLVIMKFGRVDFIVSGIVYEITPGLRSIVLALLHVENSNNFLTQDIETESGTELAPLIRDMMCVLLLREIRNACMSASLCQG